MTYSCIPKTPAVSITSDGKLGLLPGCVACLCAVSGSWQSHQVKVLTDAYDAPYLGAWLVFARFQVLGRVIR
jgi:hypothetical protein